MPERMQRLRPKEVKVYGWIGERVERTWKSNLLVLDWEADFLAPFLAPSAAGGYIGLGKTLEALVRFSAHTQDPALLSLQGQVLGRLLKAQVADGYLGMMAPPSRIVKLWDVHEMSYLILALVVHWRYFREGRTLEAARGIGDYLVANLWAARIEGIAENSVELKTLGLDRALLALHAETQDPRYLDFCREVLDLPGWGLDIVEGRHGRIEGHVYAYLTRCIAQLDLYDLTGDPKLLVQTRKALDYLRVRGGLVITGSCGQTECWQSDQAGDGNLGETCATAYLIRVLDRFLRLEGDGKYGDTMERAIFNALFAAQSPDGRRLRYYAPFTGPRAFWDRDTYCCPGNFRRIVSELPEMIFYKQEGGLTVNLYTPSEAAVEIAPGLPVRLRQETDYPGSGRVVIRVDPSHPARFFLRLRLPAWCRAFSAAVNGHPVPVSDRRPFLRIERDWEPGDTVDLDMEMDWRVIRGFGRQEGRVAVMRGPVVFCLNPKRNEALAGRDLDSVEIDPSTLSPPAPDDTVRSGGSACRVGARIPQAPGGQRETLELVLTEFPDPGGEATYFRTMGPVTAVEDELLERV